MGRQKSNFKSQRCKKKTKFKSGQNWPLVFLALKNVIALDSVISKYHIISKSFNYFIYINLKNKIKCCNQ